MGSVNGRIKREAWLRLRGVKSAGRGRLLQFLVSSQKDLALLLERHLQI